MSYRQIVLLPFQLHWCTRMYCGTLTVRNKNANTSWT